MKKLLTIFFLLLFVGIAFTQNAPQPEKEVPDPQVTPDDKLIKAQYLLNGGWLPDYDPAEIGPTNFQTLQNMRYEDTHPVGINGYSKINTTALSTYTYIKNGHQLKATGRTIESYVLVQAQDSGGSNSRVYQNQTAIPSASDFTVTQIHTDATGFGLGRFSNAPQGRISYCNGVECMDWAGNEDFVSAFFTTDDTSLTNPINMTEEVNNSLSTTGNTVSILGVTSCWVVFSSRPMQAAKYYVSTANTTASTLNAWAYTASGWTDLTNGAGWNDGTTASSKALAQTGTVTFDSDYTSSIPYHFEGLYFYAYRFQLTAGSATVSQITINAPWQAIVDIWDGVPIQPIEFEYQDNTAWEEYTLEVNYETGIAYVDEIGADIGGFIAADDEIIIMFEDRMSAIRWEMIAAKSNTNSSNATIKYWDGDSWVTVGTVTDETSVGGVSLAQTGLMSWNPPAETVEHPYRGFGTTAYAYQVTFSANLSATIVVDIITGVPAQITIKPFKFPSQYKNRRLLAGYTIGGEGNRVDFSMANAPDTFNGLDSSQDGIQSLYFGGNEPLTAGAELYNRYGSQIFSSWVAYKDTEIYILKGSSPEDFDIDMISDEIGCPAPLTLDVVSGYQVVEDVQRNGHIFLSFSGPKFFDGTTIYHIRGIDKYFDSSHADVIDFSNIENARGWVDPEYFEYNLVLPGDVWVVYDLKRKKWYQKSTGTAATPHAGWRVTDTDGTQYVYGGVDTGFMMRLENGTSWSGTAITQKLITGDFWPSKNVWDKTLIRYLKIVTNRIATSHVVEIDHLADGDAEEGVDARWADTLHGIWADTDHGAWVAYSAPEIQLDLTAGTNRIVSATSPANLLGWTHAFKFEVDTTTTERAFEPIMFAIMYQYIRDDLP
jgi:hypothetical protein